MRWQLAHPRDTEVLRFDDEAVVFNPASWETHFLNESAAFVVDLLLEHPQSVEEIVAAAVQARAAPGDDAFGEQVGALLGQLESLGLVTSSA